jgi:hypothetical protein
MGEGTRETLGEVVSDLAGSMVVVQQAWAEKVEAARRPYLSHESARGGVTRELLLSVMPDHLCLKQMEVEVRLASVTSREIAAGLAVRPLNASYSVAFGVSHEHTSSIRLSVSQVPLREKEN